MYDLIKNLCVDNLANNINNMLDKNAKSLDNYDFEYNTHSGLLIKHYYVYIISDAYPIISLLDYVKNYQSIFGPTNNEKALMLYTYIMTYDPTSYKNFVEFGSDAYVFYKASSTKDPNSVTHNYNEVYNLLKTCKKIVEAISDDKNERNDDENKFYENKEEFLTLFKLLPEPSTLEDSDNYLKIRRVDVLSTALSGIDCNFLNLNFLQTDLIVTSIETKHQFQDEQTPDGSFFGMPWSRNKAYTYVDFAFAKMDISSYNGVFQTSISPASVNGMMDGSDTSSKLADRSFANQFAQAFRVGNSFTGTYQTTINSSLAMNNEAFGNGGGKTQSTTNRFESIFYIHDTKRITQYSDNPPTYDRIKSAEFNFSGPTWKGIVKSIVSFVTGPVGTFLFDVIEGAVTGDMDWGAIWADTVNSLRTGGVLGIVDGIVSIIDGDAQTGFNGLMNST